jgi:hypothetical protein
LLLGSNLFFEKDFLEKEVCLDLDLFLDLAGCITMGVESYSV